MNAFFRGGAAIAVTYAAAGAVLLLLGKGRIGVPAFWLGIGLLLLAAAQAWLCVRKIGREELRGNLLLGPFYVLVAAAWLWSGVLEGSGVYVGLGVAAMAAAAVWCARTVLALMHDRAEG